MPFNFATRVQYNPCLNSKIQFLDQQGETDAKDTDTGTNSAVSETPASTPPIKKFKRRNVAIYSIENP